MLKSGNAMDAPAVSVVEPEQTKRVRVVRLRVIGGRIELRDDVPPDRPQCPKTRPCPHVKCEWHLWMIDGRDRPGRRHPGRRLPSSELRPVWLEWPLPPSCGADLLESDELHSWTREQKAKALGLSVDSYQWALRCVAKKLRDLAANGNLVLTEFLEDADVRRDMQKQLGFAGAASNPLVDPRGPEDGWRHQRAGARIASQGGGTVRIRSWR